MQADLKVCWVYMSKDMFSDMAAHILIIWNVFVISVPKYLADNDEYRFNHTSVHREFAS